MGIDYSTRLVIGVILDNDQLKAAAEILDPEDQYGMEELIDCLEENGVDTGKVYIGAAGNFWSDTNIGYYLYVVNKTKSLYGEDGGFVRAGEMPSITDGELNTLINVAEELGQSNPQVEVFAASLIS